MRVSVVIPTYNRAAFVCEAIESVLSQSFRDFELIVVDDGSTDETNEILTRYRDGISVVTTQNQGPSAARNRGIAAARGDWLAFLDSDDLWKPGKLVRQTAYITQNPDTAVCQTEEIWIRNGVRVNPMKKHRKYSGWIFDKCLPLCIVSPSAVMMHREVFDRVGLFDESLPACEDYDLWLRIAARYEIRLIQEPLVVKRGGHRDQQSRTVPHLDRFRIQALCKALDGSALTAEQITLTRAELEKKCRIYGNGCLKRGRIEEGRAVLDIPEKYRQPPP